MGEILKSRFLKLKKTQNAFFWGENIIKAWEIFSKSDFVAHVDMCCMGMNVKVWNTQNKDQVPQEKP